MNLGHVAATELLAALEQDFEQADTLHGVAAAVDGIFQTAEDERERVAIGHPWRLGALLMWMSDIVRDPKDGAKDMSRFALFQRGGFWDDYSFPQWADERTGKQPGTWRSWMTAVRTFLRSDEGKQVVADTGMSPERFTEMVSMDKALRATKPIATGSLLTHHRESLTDPNVSSDAFRHVLRTDQAEHDEHMVEEAARAQRWIDTGSSDGRRRPRMVVDYNLSTRVLSVRAFPSEGEPWVNVVCSFRAPANNVIALLQQVVVAALERYIGKHSEELAYRKEDKS